MKIKIRDVIVFFVLASFFAALPAAGAADVSASRLSPALRLDPSAPVYSALIEISKQDLEKVNPSYAAEDGFVFRKWDKNPLRIAAGLFGELTVSNAKEVENLFQRPAQEVVLQVNEKLRQVKQELCQVDPFLEPNDFDVDVEVSHGFWKSGLFAAASGRNLVIRLSAYAFRNPDFLRLVIQHELYDLKLTAMFPDLEPAVREAFVLMNVNISGFIALNSASPEKADRMLADLRSVADTTRGLYPRWKMIFDKNFAGDPFAVNPGLRYLNEASTLFEDICLMVADEKKPSYYPGLRQRMRNLIFTKEKVQPLKLKMLRLRVQQLTHALMEYRQLTGFDAFRPLSEMKNVPVFLKELSGFADRIEVYEKDFSVFCRIRISSDNENPEFAYLLLDRKDNPGLILGSHGRIYGGSLEKWQNSRHDLFVFPGEREKEKQEHWRMLVNESLARVAKRIGNTDKEISGMQNRFSSLLRELGRSPDLNRSNWRQVKSSIGSRQGPKIYYVLSKIIDSYLDRKFPRLFLGEMDLRVSSLDKLRLWPVSELPDIKPRMLSWLRPDSRNSVPIMYRQAEKVSLAEIKSRLESLEGVISLPGPRGVPLSQQMPIVSSSVFMQAI